MKKQLCLVLACGVAACNQHMRPETSSITESMQQAMANPVVPTSIVIPETPAPEHGSLWQPGNKQFFKDDRASEVGDMLTVIIQESAQAETEANTETERTYDGTSGLSNLLNLEGLLESRHIVDPVGGAATNMLDTESERNFQGEGSTDRTDNLQATIAAVVTQVLPNGYMVVQGKREVVVNYELQELQFQGIVRPADVSADNTIPSTKVAEARIFYAGRGVVDESQTPQYGVRFMNRIMPF